jgi:murein DD-endopeptidase MepM/ murein hydrolase activator NlpD
MNSLVPLKHRCVTAAVILCAAWCHGYPAHALPPSNFGANGNLAFVYPVMGPRMSSDYGLRKHPVKKVTRHHHGMDLAAPLGAPIRAISDGQVMYADPHGGYGKLIAIKHADGFSSHYGHCKTMTVTPGQKVKAGDIIGTVGSTGISTGPHLHFEIRYRGEPRDPETFLPGIAELANG